MTGQNRYRRSATSKFIYLFVTVENTTVDSQINISKKEKFGLKPKYVLSHCVKFYNIKELINVILKIER